MYILLQKKHQVPFQLSAYQFEFQIKLDYIFKIWDIANEKQIVIKKNLLHQYMINKILLDELKYAYSCVIIVSKHVVRMFSLA